MSIFEFAAFNSTGDKQFGTVKARSMAEAKREIKKRGFYIASIKVKVDSDSYDLSPFSFFRVLKEFFLSNSKTNI